MKTEYLVIGSGPGGAVSAASLVEHGKDVLLVEEGKSFALDSHAAFSLAEVQNRYRNQGMTISLGEQKISYAEAKTLGGGSEINSGLYHRTPPLILEKWQKDFSLQDAKEEQLVPHFEYFEKRLQVQVPTKNLLPSLVLQKGAHALNWNFIKVPLWKKNSTRQSMTQTLLPEALHRGLQLLSETKCLKLVPSGGEWKAQLSDGNLVQAKHVVLAAGAIQTPHLLQKSSLLNQQRPNTLQMHPSFKFTAQFLDVLNEPSPEMPNVQIHEFGPELCMGSSASSLGQLALGLVDHKELLKNLESNFKFFSNFYVSLSGSSVGGVHSIPFFNDPLVQYHLNEKDFSMLVDGILKLARLLFAAGAIRLFSSVGSFTSFEQVKADLVRERLKKQGRLMTVHLFSSCPAGENKTNSVTDSYGNLRGYKNLLLNDASILCSSPGVNPQGTIMAIARRNILHHLGIY